uniref:Uncharacterized protein n=1 Tax=Rhizophora mucronata TaxID=61149 RepID=A0A2P2QUQ0_RHIMU
MTESHNSLLFCICYKHCLLLGQGTIGRNFCIII